MKKNHRFWLLALALSLLLTCAGGVRIAVHLLRRLREKDRIVRPRQHSRGNAGADHGHQEERHS